MANILNDSPYEKKIKEKLRCIYNDHKQNFEEISKQVTDSKYLKIFEEINRFCLFMQFCEEPYLRTIIINSDQNANEFFNSMEEYFKSKGTFNNENRTDADEILFVREAKYKNLPALFEMLKLFDSGDRFLDKDTIRIKRLIIFREIQKVDTTDFNIIISRLIDYHLEKDRIYTNIIIFDVSYDPRGLFEKIKPNHLCRMSFNNIENIPSKNIYQEVLYKFIYKQSNNLFIPDGKNLKKIVDWINTHQISVKCFNHYFKFLMIHFFIIEGWKSDDYLIYNKFENDKPNFSILLKDIYGNKSNKNKLFHKSDIEYLDKLYIDYKNSRELFFEFYQFFEDLLVNNDNSSSTEDKYKFFFEFLQFGENSSTAISKRVGLILNYLSCKTDWDYNYIFIKKVIPGLNSLLSNNTSTFHATLKEKIEELETRINSKGDLSYIYQEAANFSHRTGGLNSRLDQNEIDLPGNLTNEEYLKIFENWLEEFFSLDCFVNISLNRKIDKNDHRIILNPAKNYLNFIEVVNPSLSTVVIDIFANFDNFLKNENMKHRNTNTKSKLKKKNIKKENLYVLEDKYDEEYIDPGDSIEEDVTSNNFTPSSENFDENYNLANLHKQYLILYAQAPVEFKLKFLFTEFLNQFGVDIENPDNEDKIELLKLHFVYFSHIFYLLGYISRKRTKGEIFMKNYYQMNNYFVK